MTYGPWASLNPSRRAARKRAREKAQGARGRRAGVQRIDDITIGPWRLTTNHVGDLMAVHRNGLAQVLALNSEETDGL